MTRVQNPESSKKEKGYRKLIAWQKANQLAHLVYDNTQNFPKTEIFGLTSQMRRAALSVCANIAEGYSRNSAKNRKHFYIMAIGSLTELEFFIDFAFERGLMEKTEYDNLINLEDETARILNGLKKSTGF
ncbi:four helix bundle protein [Candidatus Daviesbacteria bacterium]|nr:four helix bundle protein [Candidatus Daviesbacteria bacterium]